MKVDIVDYTLSTYGMPYGIKRVFQHLWFTLVDSVLEGKTFFDKPEGDGSIYCLDEAIEGGGCVSALQAALRMGAEAVEGVSSALAETGGVCICAGSVAWPQGRQDQAAMCARMAMAVKAAKAIRNSRLKARAWISVRPDSEISSGATPR